MVCFGLKSFPFPCMSPSWQASFMLDWSVGSAFVRSVKLQKSDPESAGIFWLFAYCTTIFAACSLVRLSNGLKVEILVALVIPVSLIQNIASLTSGLLRILKVLAGVLVFPEGRLVNSLLGVWAPVAVDPERDFWIRDVGFWLILESCPCAADLSWLLRTIVLNL